MKKIASVLTLLLFAGIATFAQNKAAADKTLKPALILKIEREGGANGANIAWHPVQKKYYAAMAGNETFPMTVFDVNGKVLSSDNLETMFDVRGLWYNPTSKTLQANGYDNFGWSDYKLDGKGMPVSSRKLSVATSQPDAQSVGAFDTKNNKLCFYDYTMVSIERHNMNDGAVADNIQLYLGAAKKENTTETSNNDLKDNYNQNAIIYTGIPKSEIGLLNVVDRQIELYNLANGLMTKVLKLPEDAPAEGSLNFCFTNGIYWLFNKSTREWHGYK